MQTGRTRAYAQSIRANAENEQFEKLTAEFLSTLEANNDSRARRLFRKFSLTDPAIILVVMIMDMIAIILGSMIAWYAYHVVIGAQPPDAGLYIRSSICFAAIFLLRGSVETVYGPLWGVSKQSAILKTFTQFTQAFLVFVTVLFMLRWSLNYSRGSLVTQYVVCGGAVLALRSLQFRVTENERARRYIVANRVILVGSPGQIDATRKLWTERNENFEIVKSFPMLLREEKEVSPEYLAAFAEIVIQLSRVAKPDRIVILLPFERTKEISFLVERFADVPASILVSTEQLAATQTKPEVLMFGGMNMLRVVRKPLTATDRIVKRAMDFSASAILLLLLSPLLLLTAIAIKLDSPGPVMFRQSRKGFNQRRFSIYKFRTMQTAPVGQAFKQTEKNDQRITRIGKYLRRWNIDELPQLLNVLRGEMSLVGPRPHAIEHDNMYNSEIASYARRHNIKPGITGLAQALGYRGATETLKQMQDRVNYDLLYIQNWSVLLDLKILLMTVFSSRAYQNAY